jgi:hypothetical protein
VSTGPYLSVQALLAIAKESTRGQLATATTGIPIDPNPSLKPNLTWAQDKGLRGSPVTRYDDVPLVRHDEYDAKGNVFLDTFPYLILAGLGGPDSVTGTTAPYTHTIKLLNTANAGSQPPSFSLYDYDLIQQGSVDNCKAISAAQLDTITMTFAATGALTWSAKFLGNPFVETAKPAGITYSTEVLVPAYNGNLTIDGTRTYVIESGSLSIKRQTQPIMTIGQQGPFRVWAGPLTVSGKLSIISLKTDQTLTQGLTYYKNRFNLQWTDPVSGHSMAFALTRVQYESPVVDRSKTYVYSTVNFWAEANTANAATGYSPLTFTVNNGRNTSY